MGGAPSGLVDGVSWENAAECSSCRARFSFARRRHHCRRCGGSFCDQHSNKRHRVQYGQACALFDCGDAPRVCPCVSVCLLSDAGRASLCASVGAASGTWTTAST
jgi:hypothetical protein